MNRRSLWASRHTMNEARKFASAGRGDTQLEARSPILLNTGCTEAGTTETSTMLKTHELTSIDTPIDRLDALFDAAVKRGIDADLDYRFVNGVGLHVVFTTICTDCDWASVQMEVMGR